VQRLLSTPSNSTSHLEEPQVKSGISLSFFPALGLSGTVTRTNLIRGTMNCKYCGAKFRLSALHPDPSACLECSGVADDLTISDEEIAIDVWQLSNPAGRTKPKFDEQDADTTCT
jgi:hypothetical protein